MQETPPISGHLMIKKGFCDFFEIVNIIDITDLQNRYQLINPAINNHPSPNSLIIVLLLGGWMSHSIKVTVLEILTIL